MKKHSFISVPYCAYKIMGDNKFWVAFQQYIIWGVEGFYEKT
jgi:hypothetical protein